jgi:hypothetical protein
MCAEERDRRVSERWHPASAPLAAVLHAPLPLDVEHDPQLRPVTPPPIASSALPPIHALRTLWPSRLALPCLARPARPASPRPVPPTPAPLPPVLPALICLACRGRGVQREAVDPPSSFSTGGTRNFGRRRVGARVPPGADRPGGTDRKEQVGRHGVCSVFETRERHAAGRRGVGALLVARRQRRQLVGRRRTVADVALENEERPVTRGKSLL